MSSLRVVVLGIKQVPKVVMDFAAFLLVMEVFNTPRYFSPSLYLIW